MFECLPDTLLLANLHACGFNIYALRLIQSYLSKRKQQIKISLLGHGKKFMKLVSRKAQSLVLYFSTYSYMTCFYDDFIQILPVT